MENLSIEWLISQQLKKQSSIIQGDIFCGQPKNIMYVC